MKVVGIDLAGNPKNDTGVCVLQITKDAKEVSCWILHSDEEIIDFLKKEKPSLTAIDAPLTYSGMRRRCDEELHGYGALPVTLRGMETLAKRGTILAEQLKAENINAIEVYSTASAKILGFYDRKEFVAQKRLISAGVRGDTVRRMLKKDEIDAVFAAMTAYLHLKGSTKAVGEEQEPIVIPSV